MCLCYRPDGVPMSLRNRKKLRLLQRFETREAAEAQSIKNNLKGEHAWNLISYARTKNVSPARNVNPIPPFFATPPITNFCLFF